jgi:hypothetical protein
MPSTKPFVSTFAEFLAKQHKPMVNSLSKLLAQPTFKFERGKSFDDVTALFFEYQYDRYDTMCWPVDRRGNPIAGVVRLRSAKKPLTSNSNEFYPKSRQKAFESFIDRNHEDEDNLRDAYNRACTRKFERWFITCWKVAVKMNKGGPPVHMFFSIHDTWFRKNLRTNTKCNGDEISALVKKRPG